MKFKVLSRREIENYQTDEKHVVISICDPEEKYVELPKSSTRLDSLFMRFPDIDREVEGYPYNHLVFNRDMANGIRIFFNIYKNEVNLIICQCEAGISRSAAVASSLAKSIGQDDSLFFKLYLPNMLVYKLILEEVGEK